MSLTLEKINAMKRIREEFKDLNNNPISNIGVTVGLPDEDNIFEWQCSLIGPKDTSYAGGIFILNVKFPDNYPDKAPEVVFKTPIYHININHKKLQGPGAEPLGHVCISTLNWWKPEYKMREVLSKILATSEKKISIKAKTKEYLDSVGQKLAIEAQSVVLLLKRVN